MPYFILFTQQPRRKTNWKPSSVKISKRGTTTKNSWWYASKSAKKIALVHYDLTTNNAGAKPPMKLKVFKVDKIPEYCL